MLVVGPRVDPQVLGVYGRETGRLRLFERFGARYVVNGRPIEALQGEFPPTRITLLARFPCREALEGFWRSPDYQSAKRGRADAGALDVSVWPWEESDAASPPAPPLAPQGRTTRCSSIEGRVQLVLVARHAASQAWRLWAQRAAGRQALAAYGGRNLLGETRLSVLEGQLPGRYAVQVAEFECADAARAYWQTSLTSVPSLARMSSADLSVSLWPPANPRGRPGSP